MGEELTPSQQAAAFHGLAINRALGPHERLATALKALDLYAAELERLRAQPTYEQAITHLRDTAGYDAWCDDPLRSLFRSRADDWFRDHFADYLSARLTEETTP